MVLNAITKRGFLFLETSEFDKADLFFENALNENPEDAYAYIGKLLIDLNLSKIDELENQTEEFTDNRNYELAYRYAELELKEKLDFYIEKVTVNIQNKILEEKNDKYLELCDMYQNASSRDDYVNLIDEFNAFDTEYKDVSSKIEACADLILEIDYNAALDLEKTAEMYQSQDNYDHAIKAFESLKDYKDSNEKVISLKKQLDTFSQEIAKNKQRSKKIKTIIISIMIALVVLVIVIAYFNNKSEKYNMAVDFYSNNKYSDAAKEFLDLGFYKDSKEYYVLCEEAIMKDAKNCAESKKNIEALNLINQITYDAYLEETNQMRINLVNEILKNNDYSSIFKIFNKPNDYNVSEVLISKISNEQKKNYANHIKKQYKIDYSSIDDCRKTLKNQLNYIYYVGYSDTYTEKLEQLCEYSNEISSSSSKMVGYQNYMPKIKDLMDGGFEPAKKFLEADFSISNFLIGNWKSKSNSDDRLLFYIKDESVSCIQYLPNYEDDGYYNIKNKVYSTYDSNDKKLHDVYKFTFEDVDTMKVYCYKNKKTYTLKREKTIADCYSVFNEFSSLYTASCEVANDGSYMRFYSDPIGAGLGNTMSYKVSEINQKLGLPDSLYEKMKYTRAIDGTQTETYSDLGFIVSWNYSSSYGLQVLYEVI